ncbi:MAG: hypothetical protein WCV87_03870 [Candidatus Paceibacterota bacterium]|jgi:hypothetical protein
MKRYLSSFLFSFIAVCGFLLPAGQVRADTNITSNITTNTTWTTASSTFIIQNDITINSGVTLTINPGVVVKFRSTGVGLYVTGTLNAGGSASTTYLTSYKDDNVGGDTNGDATSTTPASGDWYQIKVNSGGSVTLDNVVVRYGGNSTSETNLLNYGGTLNILNSVVASSTKYGVFHRYGNTTIATSTLHTNGYYGMYTINGTGTLSVTGSDFYNNPTAAGYFDLHSGVVVTNSGNTASGTGKRGFIMYGGSLGASQTWKADGVPYIISSSGLTVSSGKTLTINPDAVVKFENSSAFMNVSGTLTATQGAVPDIVKIVYFTSIKDDTVGGDTDGSATTTPTGGDWYQIAVYSGGTATLEHSFIGYGGSAGSNANLYNNGGTLSISTSTIASSLYHGIKHSGGTTNTKQSVFRNNGDKAFWNTTSSTSTAEYNYWGDVTGPDNLKYNPGGGGEPVSDYVDFIPWLGMSTTTDISIAAVNGGQILWKWVASSTQDYSDEWDNGVAKWNELTPIDITETTGEQDLVVEEEDLPEEIWVGHYYVNDDYGLTIGLNKAKLDGRAFNQIQNACTHELGHSLGLLHSYWENIMYHRNTFQTMFGPQDEYDYHYLWGY